MKFSVYGCTFAKKCPWISEGDFSSDPELFKTCVLVNMKGYKKVFQNSLRAGAKFSVSKCKGKICTVKEVMRMC